MERERMHDGAARAHQVLIIAKNHDGIGARILDLFHRRGYNVANMSSAVTNRQDYARITLTVVAKPELLDQIQKQIYKIIDVVKVKIFPQEGVVRRELLLVKVQANVRTRSEIVQIAQIYRGHVLDVSPTTVVIELTGDSDKVDGFLAIMQRFGITELARSGVVAMSRGEKL